MRVRLMAPDEHERHPVRGHPRSPIEAQPGDAEGGEAIEHGGAQCVTGREVGEIVEADAIDVQHGIRELSEADLRDGREELQRPFDREGERAGRQDQREVAAALRDREQAKDRERERHEPSGPEAADTDEERIQRREHRRDPVMERVDDVGHQPLLGHEVGRGALEGDEPEEGRQCDEGQEEGRGWTRDRAAEPMTRVVADEQAARWVREASHGA